MWKGCQKGNITKIGMNTIYKKEGGKRTNKTYDDNEVNMTTCLTSKSSPHKLLKLSLHTNSHFVRLFIRREKNWDANTFRLSCKPIEETCFEWLCFFLCFMWWTQKTQDKHPNQFLLARVKDAMQLLCTALSPMLSQLYSALKAKFFAF